MPTKQQYIKNQQIIANRIARLFVPQVYKALNDQIAAAVKAVRERGVMAAQGNLHGDIIDAKLGAVITDLYRQAAIGAIKKYKPRIKAGFGENPGFVSQVLAYFKKFLLNKVVLPIQKTTEKFVNKVLDEAIEKGWSVDETVKHLEDTELSQERARKIVRTEAVRSMNYSQMVAADESDFEMQKQWIATDDQRVRPTHSNHGGVDGELRDLDQPYSNGLQFPGDPTGSAREVIQCRCTQAYIAKRDENGRLIRKQPNAVPLASRLSILGSITINS